MFALTVAEKKPGTKTLYTPSMHLTVSLLTDKRPLISGHLLEIVAQVDDVV